MNVPFLDLKAQLPQIRKEIEDRFSRIIDNTAFVCGREVKEFEETFAGLHQVPHAIGVSSGTNANHLALVCCGIGDGDEVVLPVNTFIATAEAVSHAGAVPVFVDADENSFGIDTDKIEEKITERTKAVNPVHLFGQAADLGPVRKLAGKHGLMVIEDAAQAHLATYEGKKVGGFGNIASWSFYPGKNLGAWGEAGALTTREAGLQEKAMILRDHGSGRKYHHDLVGFNFRMSEFQAAVLNVKMKYLEEWTDRRRANARKYDEWLAGIPQVRTPAASEPAGHVYHLYVIRSERRDELQAYLRENGIATGLHYPVPLHLTEAYEHLGYVKGDFPVAERLADEILSLPMYPELAEEQIEYVCDRIRVFFS